MNIKLYINCKITDKNGNIISEKEQQANSLVKAFAAALRTNFSNSAVETVKDTAGTNRTMQSSGLWCVASAGTVTDGIVIGTGTNAVTISDNAVQTMIAHGTGSGQMEYGTQTFDAAVTVSGVNCYFQMARVFTNNSGGTITVKEVGIYSSIGSYDYLLDRTLIDQAVNDGQTLTLQYKFNISV